MTVCVLLAGSSPCGVRNLANPIGIGSDIPEDAMSQEAVVLLSLFGQMKCTYTIERAARGRVVVHPTFQALCSSAGVQASTSMSEPDRVLEP